MALLLAVLTALTGCLDISLFPVSDSTSHSSYSVSTTTGRPVIPDPTPEVTSTTLTWPGAKLLTDRFRP
jgi:hypothetical protein